MNFKNKDLLDSFLNYANCRGKVYGNFPTIKDIVKQNVEKVIFNGNATIVIFKDGIKTVVKKHEDDTDDREKAILLCLLKHTFGNQGKYYNYLKEMIKMGEEYELKKGNKQK